MTTSGSYDFSVSRDDLILDAMMELGLLEPGESPDAQETTDCARRLNMMLKSWVVRGYHLWAIQDAVLFMVPSQQSYSLGNAATDAEWCAWDDYNQTTTSAAAISGASTVVLTSATGFTSADRIGVVQDDGTFLWTTGTKSGSTITLGTPLTAAVASGNVVFSYTSRPVRPLRIISGTLYRRDITDGDTPVEFMAKTEYDQMTAKTQTGKVIKAAYQPFLTSGRMWTWPCADLATDVLRFSYERPLQDFDASTDTMDLPIEAAKAVYLNLAVDVAGMLGAGDELQRVLPLAREALEEWLTFDSDNAPIKFMPAMR